VEPLEIQTVMVEAVQAQVQYFQQLHPQVVEVVDHLQLVLKMV
tara:strand:+ start:149 stop:277 length:129 start_codon:yes stop_codon:yes gene_type:complete